MGYDGKSENLNEYEVRKLVLTLISESFSYVTL